jgi:hypothetical protein
MRIDLASGSGKDNDRGGGFRDRYVTHSDVICHQSIPVPVPHCHLIVGSNCLSKYQFSATRGSSLA